MCLRKNNPRVEEVCRHQLWAPEEILIRPMVNLFRFYTLGKNTGCVVECEDGTVNLQESLYHNIIYSEVEDQVIN